MKIIFISSNTAFEIFTSYSNETKKVLLTTFFTNGKVVDTLVLKSFELDLSYSVGITIKNNESIITYHLKEVK